MRRLGLASFAFLVSLPAWGQVPSYPQTLPSNTVVGRLGIGPGPSQAIPFANLRTAVGLPSSFADGGIPFSLGGNLTQNAQKLFWDNTNTVLGIGINTPYTTNGNASGLVIQGSSSGVIRETIYNSSTAGTASAQQLLALPSGVQAYRVLQAGNGTPALIDFGETVPGGYINQFPKSTWQDGSGNTLLSLQQSGSNAGLIKSMPPSTAYPSIIGVLASNIQAYDGTIALPHTDQTPSFGFYRNDALVGNGGLSGNVAALHVENHAHNTGTGNPNSNAIGAFITQDGIGDVVAVNAISAQSTSGYFAYGAFFDARTPCTNCYGFAIETHNDNTEQDQPWVCCAAPPITGIHVGAGGSKLNTSALWISEATGGDAASWDTGIYFSHYLSNPEIVTSTILDNSLSRTVLDIRGSHSTILDLTQSTVANFIINSPGFVLTGDGRGMEIGSKTVVNPSFIDFHSSGNNNDFDSRIISTGGASGAENGALALQAAAVNLPFFTANLPGAVVNSDVADAKVARIFSGSSTTPDTARGPVIGISQYQNYTGGALTSGAGIITIAGVANNTNADLVGLRSAVHGGTTHNRDVLAIDFSAISDWTGSDKRVAYAAHFFAQGNGPNVSAMATQTNIFPGYNASRPMPANFTGSEVVMFGHDTNFSGANGFPNVIASAAIFVRKRRERQFLGCWFRNGRQFDQERCS